jgi:acetamidase/formamidase
MKTLTLCLTLGVVAAGATLRAETYKFAPTVFYSTFSSTPSPALKIKSGDRVATMTVDEAGIGADGKTVLAKEPHPKTGPFYVEGAEPGDMIVVTINKLEPNRTTGMSPSVMAGNTFDAGGLSNKAAARVPWTIDKAKGVVRLDLAAVIPNIDWKTRYNPTTYELPLRPMLGSLGVAMPTKDASSAALAGPFGGNLDYAGLTAGTRVLLPVYQPGALLFLGHGQARQADGAVSGSGIDTSLDVEFSVELVKKKEWPHSSVMRASTVAGEFEIESPRIETADYVMAVGSAPTLLQAVQHATTELHHWLDDDFGFSERSLSIFLGQSMEIEIATMAEQNFTAIAKVRRAYLPKEATAPKEAASK